MPYFSYAGKKCYYEMHGAGMPLLLLHGNTASSKMFTGAVEYFADMFQVILIDFLGHGKSDRLEKFPADLWYEEGRQVSSFLEQQQISKAFVIGSSGGAQAAINAALEMPERILKIVADSFEGETPLPVFVDSVKADREYAKQNKQLSMFYEAMHGADWEHVVDCDTDAVITHAKEIGHFIHKPLSHLQADILLIGSKEDDLIGSVAPNFLEEIYRKMLENIGHGEMVIFPTGGHPAMLTNLPAFAETAKKFFLY